jgi:hypothetical protein
MNTPRSLPWRLAMRIVLYSAAAVCIAAMLVAFAIVQWFSPTHGEWRTAVRAGMAFELSVPALIRTATHLRTGPWLHGRKLHTRYGPLTLGWQPSTQSLHILCAPCTLQRPELSRQPLRFEALELSVQRTGQQHLRGAVFAGQVRMTWQGELTPTQLSIHATLPDTLLADVFDLAHAVVPQVRRATIGGTASARVQLSLPSGQWSVQPVVHNFTVRGLGTEQLLTARPQTYCSRSTALLVQAQTYQAVWLQRAVIAAEDQTFYQHPGYDMEQMLAALARNQASSSIERGASTLTQQLAKLIFTGDERTHARKLAELLYAVEMEQTLGKARILQWYLAIAPWGDGVCGLHAALHYLGKPAHQLNAVEAAWLAGMLRNPRVAAAQLQVHGQIDVQRTGHVIDALRPATRAKRQQWLAELATWRPQVPR